MPREPLSVMTGPSCSSDAVIKPQYILSPRDPRKVGVLRGGTLYCFSLLLLRARAHDRCAPLCSVMHRGGRATLWIACRRAGPMGGGGGHLCFWATSSQAQPHMSQNPLP